MEKDGEKLCKTEVVIMLKKLISATLALLFIGVSITSAQKKKESDELPVVVNYLEYSLPKVLFKVDVTLQQVHCVPGPFAKYASSKLGIEPEINTEKSVWSMKSIKVSSVSLPDAACRYILESSPENEVLQLNVTPEGLLSGVGTSVNGTYVMPDVAKSIQVANAQVVEPYSIDTYNFLEYIVDSVFVEVKGPKNVITKQFDPNSPYHYDVKNEEMVVQDVLDKIYDLRTDRTDLLRGDREIDENASLSTILKNYDKMEKEYFALFLGCSDTVEQKYTLYVDPVNMKTGQVAFRISESSGIVDTKDSSAKPVILTYSGVQLPMRPAAQLSGSDLAYRIPAVANVTVSYDNAALMSFNAIIPQWGVIQKFTANELNNLKIDFYSQYGSLKSVVKR